MFFLGESVLDQKEEETLLTEGKVNEEVLKFQNSLLESELEYQSIVETAILTEATLELGDGTVPEEKKSSKFKENIMTFFQKMIEWFKETAVKIANFVKDVVKKVKGQFSKLQQRI